VVISETVQELNKCTARKIDDNEQENYICKLGHITRSSVVFHVAVLPEVSALKPCLHGCTLLRSEISHAYPENQQYQIRTPWLFTGGR
jgi:hypothetical protein